MTLTKANSFGLDLTSSKIFWLFPWTSFFSQTGHGSPFTFWRELNSIKAHGCLLGSAEFQTSAFVCWSLSFFCFFHMISKLHPPHSWQSWTGSGSIVWGRRFDPELHDWFVRVRSWIIPLLHHWSYSGHRNTHRALWGVNSSRFHENMPFERIVHIVFGDFGATNVLYLC